MFLEGLVVCVWAGQIFTDGHERITLRFKEADSICCEIRVINTGGYTLNDRVFMVPQFTPVTD